MKNENSPAMPTVDWEFKEGYPVAITGDSGLTKLEYFALHAPACPDWFANEWRETHEEKDALLANYALSFKHEMELFKAWRYAFAHFMLTNEEV
ncbi:TPA: hypothetical protein ACX3EH_003842 [Vibrio parahaemolyticus]|uniref:hypothetical protein n=1 Tax=Vibrio parahaemolyticus TaxID=670 RepID=UPI001B81C8CB|nr:hypothetical protein [Vibrio parahaemolyticus]MCD1413750.1 hypothetical protein [Vibrio parahaemolyticus]HBC3396490.1 hypothetical protein [Vibrio parahaemolyticus]HCE4911635.1 hypothetical protein [Vibrio parahaemolyticus]HCG7968556.1 hypothetical protein [Vibrio parahaemolyticus]HCH3707023.1 hypothetical protein [Vibrio parahaemolyticus]